MGGARSIKSYDIEDTPTSVFVVVFLINASNFDIFFISCLIPVSCADKKYGASTNVVLNLLDFQKVLDKS